ncbi:hypothetical protein O3M35_001935 [Rhynocoris fuscipes]|uniref:Uncharacterized protein n=1 Tax=Rhynocoris fuscipes TaxID=488301 RepID=A0AAW1CSX8_9HEMI
MGLFNFRWFRRFVRRHTTPIPEQVALDWKAKLSLAYMFIAWNAAGVVLYMCFKGKADWPKYYGLKTDEEANKKPAVYFAELLGIKKAHVISYSGFTKTEEYNYEGETEEVKNDTLVE